MLFWRSLRTSKKFYRKNTEKGLVLLWYGGADKETSNFPTALNAEQVFPIVKAYLESEEAENVSYDDNNWDKNANHDGSNGPGWRVYTGDWGHVGTRYSICAIKKVFLWYGK